MNIYRVTVMRAEVFQVHVGAFSEGEAYNAARNHDVLNEMHPKMKNMDVIEVTDIVAEDNTPDITVDR